MRVLLVDDDEARRAQLVVLTRELAAPDEVRIVEADAIIPAKVALQDEAFDILVVDIALPRRSGQQEVHFDGGLQLLTALAESELFKLPTHVIAVTAHEGPSPQVLDGLARQGVNLVRFEPDSDSGLTEMRELVERIVAARRDQERQRASVAFETDLAIVCALAEPELSSVLALPWGWRTVRLEADSTVYHEGNAARPVGTWRVVAAACPRMGMAATTALASKMIARFRPRLIAMAGVCAGREDRTSLGDVLVPDPSWDAGSGKWALRNGKPVFLQAPHQLSLDNSVREAVRLLSSDAVGLAKIRAEWPAKKPNNVLRVLLGPVASTASVIADGVSMAGIADQHKDLLGLEMEIYGVFAAAEIACRPHPTAFAMKSVVDFGDPDKGDDVREYAAYCSARALALLVEKYLL